MDLIFTKIVTLIDRTTEAIGKAASLFSILMVLVTCYVVITRYVFNSGSIAIQETVIYLNALLFMLTAGFTLKHNGHVRVDVFYSKASPRYKAWADLFGALFLLLPVSIFIMWSSWDYVMSAWSVKETSGDAGGLPYVYLLKTLILLMGSLLILQGIAEAIRNFCILFFPDSLLALNHVDEEGSTV